MDWVNERLSTHIGQIGISQHGLADAGIPGFTSNDFTDELIDKLNGIQVGGPMFFGTSSSAGNAVQKDVVLMGHTTDFTPTMNVGVRTAFVNPNTAENPMMSVMGSEPLPMMYNGAAIPPEIIVPGIVYDWICTGIAYMLVGFYDMLKTPTWFSLTLDAGITGNFWFGRIGRLLILDFAINTPLTPPSNTFTSIGTLPIGFRPLLSRDRTPISVFDLAGRQQHLFLYRNGSVALESTIAGMGGQLIGRELLPQGG